MIHNFLIIALRSFLRHRIYSFINVFGLTTGLTVTLLIFLWVRDEWQTNRFHADVNRIFRVVTNLKSDNGTIITWDDTPGPLGDELRDNISHVEMVSRVMDNGSSLFQYEDKNFLEHGYYGDPAFFKLFSFKIIQGIQNPIDDKSSVAISNRLAKNLFGESDPIGKSIRVARQHDLIIKAVFEDVTEPSTLKFDFVLPYEIYKEQRSNGFNWDNADHPVYIKISEPEKASSIEAQLNKRVLEIFKNTQNFFALQPFADQYLYAKFENGHPIGGRIQYVKIFSIVAVFIVLIACVNFMNMATAKAATRAKEVGIRKVVGGQRKTLIIQFLLEAIFITLFSTACAILLVFLILPIFNLLVEKHISLSVLDPQLITISFIIAFITGLLAGSYPALFLSSFQPAAVLKGNLNATVSGFSLRRILVVFQFALTVILVACAIIIYQQIDYIQGKNLGYNRDGVISFRGRGDVWKQFDAFRNEVLQLASVESFSRANSSLVEVQNQNSSVNWPGRPDNSNIFFRTIVVDHDFPKTMGLELAEGRFFSMEYADTNNFILNKKAVEVMGLKNPIGQKISQWGNEGTIVGIVDDFHTRSLHESIDPVVLMCQPNWAAWIYIRLDAENISSLLPEIEKIYKKYSPEYPFNYSFVDDDFNKMYQSEKITASLAVSFTLMAIIISGLGLLGLAAYTTERKRKEIGIRKTMGASVQSLVSSISLDFAKLSLIAAVIGLPFAYFGMNEFLKGYAYRTELDWKVFAFTGICVMVLSIITVIYQVTKAAIANPVDALRNE